MRIGAFKFTTETYFYSKNDNTVQPLIWKKTPNVKQTVQDFIIPQMTQRLNDCFRMLILIM